MSWIRGKGFFTDPKTKKMEEKAVLFNTDNIFALAETDDPQKTAVLSEAGQIIAVDGSFDDVAGNIERFE